MPMSDLQLKFDGSSDIMTNIGLKIANFSLYNCTSNIVCIKVFCMNLKEDLINRTTV